MSFPYVTDNFSYIDYTGEYRIDPGNYKQLDVPIPFSDQGFTFYIKMKIDADIADNAVVFSRHGPYYGYVPPNYYMKLQKNTNGYTLSLRQNYNYNYCYADMTILPDTVTELYFYCDGNIDGSNLTGTINGDALTFYNNMDNTNNVYQTDDPYTDPVYTYLGTEINDDDGTLVNANFKGYIYRFYTSSFLNKNVVNPTNIIDALWGPFDLANTNTQYTISSNNYYEIDTPTDYSVSNFLVNNTGITFYIDFISPTRTDPFYNGELLKIYTQGNYFTLTVNSFDEFQFPTVLDTDTRYEILYNLRNVANVLVLTMLLMNNSNVYRSTSTASYTLSTNSQWYIDSVVKTNRVWLYDKLYTETQFFKPSYENYTGPSVTNELTTPIYGEYININMKRVVSFKSNTVTYNNNYVNAVYENYGTSDAITYTKDAESFSEHRMILRKLRPMYEWGYASCDFYNDNDDTPYTYIYANIHNEIQPLVHIYSNATIVIRGYIHHIGEFPVNINIPGSVDVNGTVFTSNGVYNMQVTADIIPYTATFTIVGYEDLSNIIDFGGVDFYFKTYYPTNFITNRIEYIPSQLNNPVTTQYKSIKTYPQFNVVTTDAIPYPILNGSVYFSSDIFTYPGYAPGYGWPKLYGSDPLGQLVYDAYVIGPRTITVDTDATVFISWLDDNYTPQSVQAGGDIDVNGVGLYQISISCITGNVNSYVKLYGLGSNVYAQEQTIVGLWSHDGNNYFTFASDGTYVFTCISGGYVATGNYTYDAANRIIIMGTNTGGYGSIESGTNLFLITNNTFQWYVDGSGQLGVFTLQPTTPQIPIQTVNYVINTSDGDVFTGSTGNTVFTDIQSYVAQYSNVYLVRLSGITTSSGCLFQCSTSAFLSVNEVDAGYSTNDEPTFIEFGDGSEIYNYVITVNYDTTTQLNVSGLTSYILTKDYINYTKIPVAQYEFIMNTYVINDISLPVDQHFGTDNTVITGNTFIFDNTYTFDNTSDATTGVYLRLGNIDYGTAPNADMTPFENRTYISVEITLIGSATYLTLGHENILFGPPSVELSNSIVTPNFTNNGQYIINTYNGYFKNLESNINYYGNNYIFKTTITPDTNPTLLTYDILAFNEDVDPQHFSFILSDGSNVETNTFTKGDLITIPNFYDSNTAIANYKTTII